MGNRQPDCVEFRIDVTNLDRKIQGRDSAAAIDCDIAVVGAGLGGISAALRAAEAGKRVVLIEARDAIGGTAAFSGGGVHIWGKKTWPDYYQTCPRADPLLAKKLFDTYLPYVRWLESTKAPGQFGSTALRGLSLEKYQIGRTIAPRDKLAWFAFMEKRLRQLGVVFLTGARATGLIQDSGAVRGVIVNQRGRGLEISARAVILAAGGFQADPGLLAKYTGGDQECFVQRSVDTDVGDGLRLALEAGATTSPSMNTIYGHLMPAPPATTGWTDHIDPSLMSAFYAQHGIVINVKGERFVDEGDGELTGATINAACQQPPGGLWMIFDETIRRVHFPYQTPFAVLLRGRLRDIPLARYLAIRRGQGGLELTVDSFRMARDRGAIVHREVTLEALADKLAREGVPKGALLGTVAAFNASIQNGRTVGLPIPKIKSAWPIETGPFWAIKVAVGVSMTYGGVAIDEYARALDAERTPVPGLYAVPGTAGGIHNLHYAGALAACGTYGMIAADHAIGRN